MLENIIVKRAKYIVKQKILIETKFVIITRRTLMVNDKVYGKLDKVPLYFFIHL